MVLTDIFSSHLWHILQYKIQVFSLLWWASFLWKFRLLSYCNLCTLSLLSLALGTPHSYCHRHSPRTYPQSSLQSIPLASCLHPLSSANGNTPIGRRVFQNSTHNLFEFQLQHNHFSVIWAFHFLSFVHQLPLQLSTVIECHGGITLVCRVAGHIHVAVCAWTAWEMPVNQALTDSEIHGRTGHWWYAPASYTAIYALLS